MGTADALGKLLAVLPLGLENGTTVSLLSRQLRCSDREVRAGIESLVTLHRVPVYTLPASNGVFIATTPEELDAGIAHVASKAGALLRRKRALRLCRERLAWRPTLFE